jgi:hypothetical protein
VSPAPEAMPAAPGPIGHAPEASRVRRALAAIDAWYRPVGVPERLAALRLLIGGFAAVYVTARLPNLLGLSELGGFRGVGVTSLLSAALPAWLVTAQALLAVVLGVAFVLGFKFRVTGPAFALALLWVMTYRNSFGMVFHTENLLVTHVLVLGCSRAADAWSLDARRRPPPVPSRSHGWPVQLLAVLTVAGYLLAGIAKLRLSGLSWASSDLLRNYIAYDNLRKLMLADTYSPIGAWLVGYPALFPPLAFASLAMELLAPLALLGRRVAAVWSLAAWSFHLGVLAIMAIFFPYPLFGLAFAPFFAVERLFLFRRLRAR